MGFVPSPAERPPRRVDPEDPRFAELFVDDAAKADLLLGGIPFDGAVIGRKGCADGPRAIREAFRFVASHDPDNGVDLAGLRIHDLGDVGGLAPADVLATHAAVQKTMGPIFRRGKPVVVLGGDNSLSYPVVAALAGAQRGRIGVVVIDAHYDVRIWKGQPTSGTPYGRILEELPDRPVAAKNLVEVGIRPFANTAHLAARAADLGLRVITVGDVRRRGMAAVAKEALRRASDGVDQLWLSIDIDGLDQSVAPGCSAPGVGGLSFDEAAALIQTVAADKRIRGMDLMEVAPNLDPSGNTARVAAQLVAHFAGAVSRRKPAKPSRAKGKVRVQRK